MEPSRHAKMQKSRKEGQGVTGVAATARMRKVSAQHESNARGQPRNKGFGTADQLGGSSRFAGKLVSLIQSREERFAAFASMARRDIEQSMHTCSDGPEEWLATPGALKQMRMQMQGSAGCFRSGRLSRHQDSFEKVERQLKEQKLFMQQLQESQQEQNILQQQLLKLITYGMIGGERARAGARPVEKHARDNSETPEPVTHQVNHDPPVQGVIAESAGNTFNTVISWLQGRVRGNPSRTDSKVSSLTLGSGSRLKEVLGTQLGRPSKNIEGSRSLTIESDDQASDCSKSNFRPARKSSSKRQPETNISSYVILPVRRPKTASRKDREHKKLLLHRNFGKSKEPFYSENDVDCERGNDFSGSQPNSQGTIAGNGGNHWDLNYGRRPQPIRIHPLLDHVAEIRRMEDSVRQKWFNPEMEKEVQGRREHDKSSLSNTTTPTDEHATFRSHRADEGAGQNAPTVVASPVTGGRSTKADEERRANAWLTEIILEGILADIGRELGSLCDEFVEHICSCEFLTDDE